MRLYNSLVFDQTVRGTGEVFSPPEFNELLGRADNLTYEIEVEEAAGVAPTITVRHLEANSGKKFLPRSAFVSGDSLASLPYRKIFVLGGPLGGLGQIGIALGASGDTARVRVWACGRSS